MLKKLIVPATCAFALTGCLLPSAGGTTEAPSTTGAATTVAPATTAAPTPTVAPPTTAAPATAAPTTAIPATAAPTTAAPVATAAPAQASAGGLDVIAISGLGGPLPDSSGLDQLGSVGLTTDPAADIVSFGGSGLMPVPILEGGRLIDLNLTTGSYLRWEFTYVTGNPNGQSVEEVARAAAAPIAARFPAHSEVTSTREDGTTSYFQVGLESEDFEAPEYEVSAGADSERPGAVIVRFTVDAPGDNRPTGASMMPPYFAAAVEPYITKAQLSADQLTEATSRAGASYGTVDAKVELTFEVDLPYADTVNQLRPLVDQGYEIDESDSDYTVFDGGTGYENGHYQILDNDDSDTRGTVILFSLRTA